MGRLNILIALVLLGVSNSLEAQDCSSPILLCSGVTEIADSSTFSGPYTDACISAGSALFYEFTTNNSVTNPSGFLPYEVTADILPNSCIDAGLTLELTVSFYEVTVPGTFCAGLNPISTCETDSLNLSVSSGALQPNTNYAMVIGINNLTTGFSCDLEVTLSGAPLELAACCDDNIPLGLSSELQVFGATEEMGVENYIWSPFETIDDFQAQNPTVTPATTTEYTVRADVGDCEVSDQVLITVERAVTVLNTFSPNGDGINETWKIARIENFSSALINVYDRWGQPVYKSIGYSDPWDGTNDGKELVAGTYYYVIELNSLNVVSEPITGFVVILR